MKIAKVESFLVKFKLTHPSAVAYSSLDEVQNIIVKITTSDGKTGWGNCAPDPEVTDEIISDVKKFLETEAVEILKGENAESIDKIDRLLRESGHKYYSAFAGINIALYDLLGKKLGKPIFHILGKIRSKIKTSYTIGLIPIADAINLTHSAIKNGFKVLKIKIGESLDEDIERIKKIYEITGKEIPLRLDANQAYSPTQVSKLLSALKNLPIQFLEQPTPKDNLLSLKEITLNSSIPIMADESVVTLADCARCCVDNCANLINIKLMKSGGISDAIKQNAVARSFRIKTMIGCMDESIISITAGLHFALSQKNTIYADLDGHFDIKKDIATGGINFKNGLLYPTLEPGLGVIVKL